MSRRSGAAVAIAAALLSAVTVASNEAHACGGCFVPNTMTTVVTGHRMALSVSTQRTVLWDQIQYAGSPEDFAWVLPVKPGAYLELASNAFFEALDAATSTTVAPPQVFCSYPGGGYEGDGYYPTHHSGCSVGCQNASYADGPFAGGAGGAGGAAGGPARNDPPPVTVVHQESVGPYETVTVHSNKPGALYDWLTGHAYDIPMNVEPIIDAYEKEGFDFIALRLTPGNGVQQMQPVRVVSPGASPALPLRMVAAGTGANVAITLFVIGEGRWEPKDFPSAEVAADNLTWDYTAQQSNYATLRKDALATNDGRTWIAAYAKKGALLSPFKNPVTMGPTIYTTSNGTTNTSTIAELYYRQALVDGDPADLSCMAGFLDADGSTDVVVDPCADQGGGGGAGGGSGGTTDTSTTTTTDTSTTSTTDTGTTTTTDTSTTTTTDTGTTSSTSTTTAKVCNGTVGPDQIDGRTLACGSLDDIEAALIGMHPSDTWVTRLESNLPQKALADDLLLQASASQTEIEAWRSATKYTGNPCPNGGTPATITTPGGRTPPRDPGQRRREELAIYACIAAAAAAAFGRRLLRPALRLAKAPR
jgi:hypothetical protein